jgi:Mg2+ and Co2+ transporter CorA
MDKRIEQITSGLNRLLKNVETSFIAQVVADKADVVDVKDLAGTIYLNVRKIATQGKKGILFRLKQDSYVIVSRISNSNDLYISMMSEIEGADIAIERIVINNGENEGLVKVRKLEQNLENIKTYLSNLNTAIATGLSGTVSDGGAAASTAFSSAMEAVPLIFEDMENKNIKH